MSAQSGSLRRGWTTGACATAAAKAACAALVTGIFPDPVEIALPGGKRAAFALATTVRDARSATVGVVKDAGDDPDVTHGALIIARVRPGEAGAGVTFRAGEGVGTVTRPGLAIPPGEAAINPVPRQMIQAAIFEIAGAAADYEVEISVRDGAALAMRTLNPRLGIVGGLSILGTTGVVIPFSCSAWIHSIHRGIDVARAAGAGHIAGATGSTSERAVQQLHALPDVALVEMGDFVGGMLKYVRKHPVRRLTIAGGVAKMTKLAQGLLDLHSARGTADLEGLAVMAVAAGGSGALAQAVRGSNTVAEAFAHAAADRIALGDAIAEAAWITAAGTLEEPSIALEIAVFDRDGALIGRKDFAPAHASLLKRRR